MASKYTLEFEKPILELEAKIKEMRSMADQLDIDDEIAVLEGKVESLRENIFNQLTRWQRVQLARHPERPFTLDMIRMIFTDFIELHGDRAFGDDPAIVGGMARFDGASVMVIGHQKGHDTKSNLARRFGMPNPEGYRKALRLFKLAEKFSMPVITFIDTPGAYPGIEAEERGQAEAIARNLFEMARLRTPVINIVIGEGASGGALGIGMGDRFYMMENTWYSVIAPESCSVILWRSVEYKEQAAEALRLTAADLLELGLSDGIIPEPVGGAHRDNEAAAESVATVLRTALAEIGDRDIDELLSDRSQRYRAMGVWESTASNEAATA